MGPVAKVVYEDAENLESLLKITKDFRGISLVDIGSSCSSCDHKQGLNNCVPSPFDHVQKPRLLRHFYA